MFWSGFEKRAWSKDTIYRRIHEAASKRLPPPSSESLSPVSDAVRAVNQRFIHNQATRASERYLKGDKAGAKKAVSRLRTVLTKKAISLGYIIGRGSSGVSTRTVGRGQSKIPKHPKQILDDPAFQAKSTEARVRELLPENRKALREYYREIGKAYPHEKKGAVSAGGGVDGYRRPGTIDNLQEDQYKPGKVTVDMKPKEDAVDISHATHREMGQAPQNPFMGY